MADAYLHFELGPLDGTVLSGLAARAVLLAQPPFACLEVDGRWEHYVDEGSDEKLYTTFTYAGPCRDLVEHPECGHDHERSADQQHTDAHTQVDLALDGPLHPDEAAVRDDSHKAVWISTRAAQYRDGGLDPDLALRLAADDWNNRL
jgi:hypothetical protein